MALTDMQSLLAHVERLSEFVIPMSKTLNSVMAMQKDLMNQIHTLRSQEQQARIASEIREAINTPMSSDSEDETVKTKGKPGRPKKQRTVEELAEIERVANEKLQRKQAREAKRLKKQQRAKRAPSSYMMWLNSNRSSIISELEKELGKTLVGRERVTMVAKRGGEKWKSLSDADRNIWKVVSEANKAEILKDTDVSSESGNDADTDSEYKWNSNIVQYGDADDEEWSADTSKEAQILRANAAAETTAAMERWCDAREPQKSVVKPKKAKTASAYGLWKNSNMNELAKAMKEQFPNPDQIPEKYTLAKFAREAWNSLPKETHQQWKNYRLTLVA